MKTQWYGDKRDLVKWGTLVCLCTENSLKQIIHVPFLNDGNFQHALKANGKICQFPKVVWEHFRDLNDIQRLAKQTGLLRIHILPRQFSQDRRTAYIDEVCRTLDEFRGSPKLVFLDPDTGIEPSKATARHVKIAEIDQVWRKLQVGDWLVLYQHALRANNWRPMQRKKFAAACGGAKVRTFECGTIAHDVVFFCAERES